MNYLKKNTAQWLQLWSEGQETEPSLGTEPGLRAEWGSQGRRAVQAEYHGPKEPRDPCGSTTPHLCRRRLKPREVKGLAYVHTEARCLPDPIISGKY